MRGARVSSFATSANTRRSPRSALWPIPASSMFSAPARRALVCGATIESCHDHSDTRRTPAGAPSARLSSASHALPGRSWARGDAREEPRVDAAMVRRAQRHHRGHLLRPVSPQVGPRHQSAHAVPDDRDARRAGRGKDRIDLGGDLIREHLDRRQRRTIGQRVHGARCSAGDEIVAQARATRPRCRARRAEAGPEPRRAPAPARASASGRAPCAGPTRPIARISSRKRRSVAASPIRRSCGRSERKIQASANQSSVIAKERRQVQQRYAGDVPPRARSTAQRRLRPIRHTARARRHQRARVRSPSSWRR